jgi:sensor histidine kinase regulating citrate/malate metabolism
MKSFQKNILIITSLVIILSVVAAVGLGFYLNDKIKKSQIETKMEKQIRELEEAGENLELLTEEEQQEQVKELEAAAKNLPSLSPQDIRKQIRDLNRLSDTLNQ